MATDDRLNVLLITSDQQRWDTLGRDNPVIKTPNLDRLAEGGIQYTRAYTPNPTCTPARVSILTGQYPSRHGCYTIGTNLPSNYPTVPALLASQGYRTALIGKAHFSSCLDPGSFEAAPNIHDLCHFESWDGPFYGFDHVQLAIGHTVEKHACGMHYGAWLREQGVRTETYFGNNKYADHGVWELPEEYHNSRWTADKTIDALKTATGDGKPFFIWSSFQDPHNPWMVPEPWASMYDGADVPTYGLRPGEHDAKPRYYRTMEYENRPGGTDEFGEKNWHPVTSNCFLNVDECENREIVREYYGMISLMDHHVGRILDHVEASGLAENTLVVFASDHGDYLGNHGLWWKGLPAYEDIVKVPMIVRHPECQTPGQRSTAYQSLVDVGRTVLKTAGVAVPYSVQGIDQTSSWMNANRADREWVIVENRPTEGSVMQKTFIHDGWKLILYDSEELGELYNLVDDPDQTTNLYTDLRLESWKNALLRRYVSAEMHEEGVLRPRTARA